MVAPADTSLPGKYSKKHNSRKDYEQNFHEYPTSKGILVLMCFCLKHLFLRLFLCNTLFLEVFLQNGNQCLGISTIISLKNNCGLRMGKKK